LNKIVLVLLALTVVSGVGVLSWNNFVVELQPFQIFNSFAEFDDSQCACANTDGEISPGNCNAFDGVPYSDPNGMCTSVADLSEYGSPGKILSAQGCGVGFWKNGQFRASFDLDSSNIVWPEGYNPDYYFNDIFQTTIGQPQGFVKVDEAGLSENEDSVNTSEEDEMQDTDVVLRDQSEDEIVEEEVEAAENEDSVNTSEEDEVQDTDVVLRDQLEDEIVEEEVEAESISEQEIIQNDESDRGPTLLEALNARGGDMNSLLRHSVAALLNAAHPEINYPYSVVQVLELTQISIINENYQDTIDKFEQYNENAEKPSMCLE